MSEKTKKGFKMPSSCLLYTSDYAIKSGTYEKDYLFDLALLKVANSV